MPINLSNKDHKDLDKLLEAILTWHVKGEVSTKDAIAVLAHVFTAAAKDNEGEVDSWLNKPDTLTEWKGMTDAHRS